MAEFTYSETRTKQDENLFLTKVLGFAGLAILGTAAFGYLFANLFTRLFVDSEGYISDEGAVTLVVVLLIAVVASMIISAIGNVMVWKRGKAPYLSYGAYAVVQGLLFGSMVIFGVESVVIGGALGITAIAFLMCFALGYFSKGRLGWAKLIVATLSMGLLLNFLIFGLLYLFIPGLYSFVYPLISFVVLVVVVLYIAIDANRIKNTINEGYELNNELAVSFAFTLYADYMMLFWKVLRILMILGVGSRRK